MLVCVIRTSYAAKGSQLLVYLSSLLDFVHVHMLEYVLILLLVVLQPVFPRVLGHEGVG